MAKAKEQVQDPTQEVLYELATPGTMVPANGTPPTALTARTAGGYALDEVGTGFEDFTQDDFQVPFIVILQKNSPQVEEENPKYIKGAKAGTLMNTVSQELYDGKEGVAVIPVHRVRSYIEWIPKDEGGGLVNVFSPEAPEVREVLAKAGRKFGKLKIGDNNDLAETFNVFCLLVLPGGRVQRVVLGFASSQIGAYKRWMTTAQSIQRPGADGVLSTPPLFSHRYRLRTQFFQKKEYTWHKWVATFDGADAAACNIPAESPLFEEAKKFRALLMSGQAQADYSNVQQEHTGAESEFEM